MSACLPCPGGAFCLHSRATQLPEWWESTQQRASDGCEGGNPTESPRRLWLKLQFALNGQRQCTFWLHYCQALEGKSVLGMNSQKQEFHRLLQWEPFFCCGQVRRVLSSHTNSSYCTTQERCTACKTAHALNENLDVQLFYSSGSQHFNSLGFLPRTTASGNK